MIALLDDLADDALATPSGPSGLGEGYADDGRATAEVSNTVLASHDPKNLSLQYALPPCPRKIAK